MSKEIVLQVKDLTVSFKTPNGMVRAVREVSFDLDRGETLAIVGESGSGKSVTNRAIMGILARNAVIDKGEILYRNQDLTKLSEVNFHKIRGSKIGMIFQDPLSSLNPIMKIGKQVTEAMLVNGDRIKSRYRDLYHHEFHDYLNQITRIKIYEQDIKDKKFELRTREDLSRAERKELYKQFKTEKKAEIAELKAGLSGLKAKFKAKRAEAKVQIKQEKAALKAEQQAELARLKEELANTTTDDERKAKREEIHTAKETFRRKFKVTRKEAYERAIAIMDEVGIPEPTKRFNQYPFQFSGGMRQRIVIAIALTANPEILICDEPTTALDVTIQQQILNLIKEIKAEHNLSVIFITHDLGVVANMADRVAVMYAGKIVEYGMSEEIFYDPKHPYTWALLSSVPDLDTTDRLLSIPGTPPDMLYPPRGDAFAERNQYALKIDFEEQPPYFKVSDSHYAATWLLHPDAPKIQMPSIILERVERYQQQSTIDKKKRQEHRAASAKKASDASKKPTVNEGDKDE